MMTNNIPVSVNYTNRDFYSLRDDLIARIQSRVNTPGNSQWSANDPSDFGVALVEAFSYIGDITNYYIDRAANEGFLATAVNRQSLLDLSSLFGYSPSGWRQASVTIQVRNQNSTSVYIPAGTQLSTNIVNGSTTTTLYYTLIDDIYVPGNSGVSTGTALHGQDVGTLPANAIDVSVPNDIPGELLGFSSGLPAQSFTLLNTPVADGSISVYVYDGSNFIVWSQVDHLTDYGSTDTVYRVSTDANDVVTITFGDGVNGSIPTYGMRIKASYSIGGGLIGNISALSSFTVVSTPSGSGVTSSSLQTGLTITNPNAASGGSDPESNDSIRSNAPSAIRTLSRAVSLRDYAQLAFNTPNITGDATPAVGKAAAKATQPNSVVLYIGPYVDPTSSDYYPGFNGTNTAPTASWYSLQSAVLSYLSDKTQIGVTVTVSPPNYVPVKTSLQYELLPGYSHDQVISALRYGLIYGFGYNFLDFNTIIKPEQIEATLASFPGVLNLKAVQLYTGLTPGRNTLVANNGDYFVFTDTNTNIYPIASLSALAVSGGTLSPTFTSSIFSYSVTGVSTTTTTITPTVWDSTCTITVNGTTVSSGSGTSVSTPTGSTTTVTVIVTTADLLSTNTYTLSIIR